MRLQELTADDDQARWALGRLAFGGDPSAQPEPPYPGLHVGAFDGTGRLVARASARPYTQWWCGQQVPMCGIAGVVVHPDARGQGLVGRMLGWLVERAAEPVSVLYPTAAGIYRRLGWEVVGTLDDTSVALSALPQQVPDGVVLRSAVPADLPALADLYAERGAAGSGLLTRTGPSFPKGPTGLREVDVATVALEGGQPVGYTVYDRGRGCGPGSALRVWEAVAGTPSGLRGLLAGLASWGSVVETVRWRGRTDDLALALGGNVPPGTEAQPWMLRVLDPVAAVSARGFGGGTATASFAVEERGYRLEVDGGRGTLTETDPAGLPRLSDQGLALLFAGVAQGRLLRAGLIDRPAPQLEEAFAGPRPEILDYF